MQQTIDYMDHFYNKDKATSFDKGHQQDQKPISDAYIQKDKDAGAWRIVQCGSNEVAVEEIVFTITGAINSLDLPLVTRETRTQKEKARFLSQTIHLTGLGSTGFEDSVKAIKVMQQMGECPARCPEGILARLMQQKLMHTDDNIVSYFKGEIDERGKKRYTIAKPQIFWAGDIVEAQCSMVFLKSNNSVVKLKVVLRAVALVNCDHSMQASSDRKNATDQPGPTMVRMKRKIGFSNDMDKDEYEGVKRMNEGRDDVDDDDNGMAS
ncbi:hypothetical protein IW262DRAFT_1296908 [Armillaria fumosa]|nr:hypothetical protein IW262DRAFT_1296908 [Armillaria fumosa]